MLALLALNHKTIKKFFFPGQQKSKWVVTDTDTITAVLTTDILTLEFVLLASSLVIPVVHTVVDTTAVTMVPGTIAVPTTDAAGVKPANTVELLSSSPS